MNNVVINETRPASAVIGRRRRASSGDTSKSDPPQTSHSDVSPMRTYTACGILGLWSKRADSGIYDESPQEREPIPPDAPWTNEAIWNSMIDSASTPRTHSSIHSPLPQTAKVFTRAALFESMQKASGEKVLSRIRERQMSLTGSNPFHHTPPQIIPPRTAQSTTPTPPRRSYPRKLQPLPKLDDPPWSTL